MYEKLMAFLNVYITVSISYIDSNLTPYPNFNLCFNMLVCDLDVVKYVALCVKLATLTIALISFFFSRFSISV